MPYKDSEEARLKSKERMRKYRQGVTTDDVTPADVTPCKPNNVTPLLHRTNGADYDPDEVIHGHTWYPDGTLRYVPCHDGQALDRLTTPNP